MRHSKTLAVVFAALLAITLMAAGAAFAAEPETTSVYITTRDGTRLAVDVHLPADRPADARLPALLVLTRYWRSSEDPATGRTNWDLSRVDMAFLDHGYAVVKVDLRGSGASFGSRETEYGPQEVKDGWDVVEWVVRQSWSSGVVGAYGTSYTGTTAEFLTAVKHPAVKAVIPGWSDFDAWRSPVRPYGLLADAFLRTWAQYVGWLDSNDAEHLGAHVRRVDGDTDGAQRAAAVAEHRANSKVYEPLAEVDFRDQLLEGARYSFAHVSSLYWKEAIEESGVPMLVLASWLDAGVADGALQRFQHYRNPQRLVILASSHGGRYHASPYVVGDQPLDPVPSLEEQEQLRLDFFDHYLEGEDNGVDRWPAVRYFDLGEETFKETDVWPPAGTGLRRYYLREDAALSTEPPVAEAGADLYTVDFTVTTGPNNRWMTQMGQPVLGLDDRGAMDAKMLTYTTAPLAAELQVTGTPVVSLQLSSTHPDGAFLVYLEEVDPEGRSRYVTEGGLRAIHRRLSKNPHFEQKTPYHSFAEADAQPLVPGETAELTFQLWPTSVLFRKGHRIRLAIAGADDENFRRVPAEGTPTLTVARNAAQLSWLDLPVVAPGGEEIRAIRTD